MTVVEFLARHGWFRKKDTVIELNAVRSLWMLRDELIKRRQELDVDIAILHGDKVAEIKSEISRVDILSVALYAESVGMRIYVAPIDKP